jgi:hypothetical protein
MSKVRDILNDALMLLGVQDPTESINAAQAQACLRRLNAMLSTWSAQGLMVYTFTPTTFPLTIGKQSYTIGAGGDFNVDRPIWLNQVSIIPTASAPNLEIPIDIDSDDDWQNVLIKSVTSTFPLEVHPRGDYPLQTLDFWPVPTAACSVVLYLPQQLGQFATMNDTISFPPGYEEAITYAVVTRIAPLFGIPVSPDIARMAVAAKDTIQAQNLVVPILRIETALCGNPSGPSEAAIKSKGRVVD